MEIFGEIYKEHGILREKFSELDELDMTMDDFPSILLEKLKTIGNIWNKHEIKEDKLFRSLEKKNIHFPVEKMEIAHRQLKGHWSVLMQAVESEDPQKISIALDTDGKMFIEKLKNHMNQEEKMFEKYIMPKRIQIP